MFEDWDLIVSSFLSQYGLRIRTKDFETVSWDEFKALVEAPTVDQFMQLLSNTYYENRFHAMQRSEGMEQFYKACIHGMYLSDRRRNPYSLATVNTYLFLKEEEINRLTTALECIRYGLTPRETLGYIGGAKK